MTIDERATNYELFPSNRHKFQCTDPCNHCQEETPKPHIHAKLYADDAPLEVLGYCSEACAMTALQGLEQHNG